MIKYCVIIKYMSDSTSKDPDFVERNEQTLADIDNLQQLEKRFYEKLSGKLTEQQRESILSKIDQLYTMRMGLYKNLQQSYEFYEDSIDRADSLLADQMAAIKLVEQQLDKMKQSVRVAAIEKNNQVRLAEINTYYGKQYSAHSKLMIIIILVCIPIILVSALGNRGWLSPNVVNIIMSIVLVLGGVCFVYKLSDLYNRDNMNYDEYDWYFNKNNAPSID